MIKKSLRNGMKRKYREATKHILINGNVRTYDPLSLFVCPYKIRDIARRQRH